MQVSPCLILKRHRRNAVAGVVAAALIFAMIFTAGMGYYVYESRADLINSQAQLAKLAAGQQSNQEQLAISVSQSSGSLVLDVYNVGGIPATVTAVFVTSEAAVTGTILTNYAGSSYLVGTLALNATLPLTLAVGASTAGIHNNIMINPAACSGCLIGTVYVNVLTLRGNVFSAEYPLPVETILTTATEPTVTTGTTGTLTVLTSTSSTTSSWTTLATSSTQTNGFAVGTNSLIVTMNACPGSGTPTVTYNTSCVVVPAIYQGDEVILTVSVTNYATAPMSTYVVFQSIGTNGASVTGSSGGLPGSYDCATGVTPTPQTINPSTTSTFICTFYANTGSTAGTVTFIGYAVGTYTTSTLGTSTVTMTTTSGTTTIPTTTSTTSGTATLATTTLTTIGTTKTNTVTVTTSTTSGTSTITNPTSTSSTATYSVTTTGSSNQITSAETTSDTLQLGNPSSGVTGPWIDNPYYFRYASEEHQAFSSAAIMSASGNHEVMYHVEVTNTANVSLTILQYSFMIYFNFNEQEMDFYIVNPATTWSSTLTAYNCATTGGAPTGSSCITGTVPVGGTALLTLAACEPTSPGDTYFMWAATGGGDSNSACSNNNASFVATSSQGEGEVGFVVVEYSLQNSKTGVWSTFAQTLPLEATYVSA